MTAPLDNEPVMRALFTVLGMTAGGIAAIMAYETSWGVIVAAVLGFLLIGASILTSPEVRT